MIKINLVSANCYLGPKAGNGRPVHNRANTDKHTFTLLIYKQTSVTSSPDIHVFELCRKPEHPKETHANTEKTC